MTAAGRADAVLADAIEAEAWADMVMAAPAELVGGTGLRCLRRGAATCLVAPGLPFALLNRAIGLGADAPAARSDVDEILAIFREAGARHFWIHVSPAAGPAALEGWLRERGLAPDARFPAWAKVLRGPGEVPRARTSLRVVPVGRGRAAELGEVLAAAHGMPAPFASWFAALALRSRWHAYAALDGDRIVSGGLLYLAGRAGWLGAGGTLAAYRGRGAHGALMARRISDAGQMGCSAIATETDDRPENPSLRNMLRCGFRRVCARVNYGPPEAAARPRQRQ